MLNLNQLVNIHNRLKNHYTRSTQAFAIGVALRKWFCESFGTLLAFVIPVAVWFGNLQVLDL